VNALKSNFTGNFPSLLHHGHTLLTGLAGVYFNWWRSQDFAKERRH